MTREKSPMAHEKERREFSTASEQIEDLRDLVDRLSFCLSEAHDYDHQGYMETHEKEDPDCSYCKVIKDARNLPSAL